MTPEQWTRLKAVFLGALDQPVEARTTYLADACAGDEELLREARALLDTHETDHDFLERPATLDPDDLHALAPGARLGPYSIVEEIGRGGMGIVYLAEDSRLGRRVALKALPPVVAANQDLRERLRREARAVATISHPGVATVYALEEIDEHLVIASEYVPGETLRARLTRGPIDPARVTEIATQDDRSD
jgi:serine/threonine-protein kinase